MDQPESAVPVQAPHVHKMWNVLSVLFLVLFILSAVFNVFLFMSWSGQTEVVEDLEEDIEELVIEEEEVSGDEDIAMEEVEVKTRSFDRFGNLPVFDYPENWQVALIDGYFSGGDRNLGLVMSQDPIWFCDGCDGPRGDVIMKSYPSSIDSDITGASAASAWQAEDSIYSNVTVDESEMLNGTLTKLSAHADSYFAGEFDTEQWIFTSESYVLVITFEDYTQEQTNNDAWEIVKNSLDFTALN